jgi:hypothetical protein
MQSAEPVPERLTKRQGLAAKALDFPSEPF